MSNINPKSTKSSTADLQKQAKHEGKPMVKLSPDAVEQTTPKAEFVTHVANSPDAESAGFGPMGTNSTPLELLDQARIAAASLDIKDAEEKERRKKSSDGSKADGRAVLKYMLCFVESFKNVDEEVDEKTLQRFLDTHVGKAHGSANSPYQRISKYCAVNDTAKSLVSKRAYALDAIVKRKIKSSELDEDFEKKEPIGPDRLIRSGMQKYILLHQIENDLVPNMLEKYEKMKADRLIGETLNMLSALLNRQMLPDSLVADAKKRLEVELQKSA